MNIEPSELDEAIQKILEEASVELKNKISVASEEIAKEAVKTLRKNSPVYTGDKNGRKYKPGAYARSWMYVKNTNQITNDKSFTVYNDKHYRLTHLLENGHVNRDGSRTRTFKHIDPVNNTVCKDFERKVEEAINEG